MDGWMYVYREDTRINEEGGRGGEGNVCVAGSDA